jgi:Asp-tRNA(Asn)/Glu-tRNA(Gln) amidotransferase A subunit family amidase
VITPLSPEIRAAINRAAERIEKESHEAEYDAPTVTSYNAAAIITEELTAALAPKPCEHGIELGRCPECHP